MSFDPSVDQAPFVPGTTWGVGASCLIEVADVLSITIDIIDANYSLCLTEFYSYVRFDINR